MGGCLARALNVWGARLVSEIGALEGVPEGGIVVLVERVEVGTQSS